MFRFRNQACHGRHAYGFAGHRFRERGGGGRRGMRIFDQGDLRFVILKLISEKESHGYDIIRAIEERVGGAYSPSPGVVYPTLNLLEEMGYVTARAEGGKKLFTITNEGRAALAANQASVDGIFRRMDDLHDRYDGPAPRIGRAMENLGAAIRSRTGAGPVSPEQLSTMVDAIDRAAREVETA